MLLIYVTYPNITEAEKTVAHLLNQKLIACATIFEVNSHYQWQGSIAHEPEMVSLLKTLPHKAQLIENEIVKLHSYSIPCIIQMPAKVNESYMEWLKNELEN